MALKFCTTDEARAHGVKALIYGGSGVGKTKLLATAPKPLIWSAESGLLSLRQHKLPCIKIEDMNDLDDAYAWTMNNLGDFKSLGVDSASEIAEQTLSSAKQKFKDPRQAYGEMQDRLIEILKALRDIEGLNVFVIAKQQRVVVNDVAKYGPWTPGKGLGPQLPYLFDEVFCLRIGGTGKDSYRYLQTQPDDDYDAKDRSGALDFQEEPNLAKLVQKITKS